MVYLSLSNMSKYCTLFTSHIQILCTVYMCPNTVHILSQLPITNSLHELFPFAMSSLVWWSVYGTLLKTPLQMTKEHCINYSKLHVMLLWFELRFTTQRTCLKMFISFQVLLKYAKTDGTEITKTQWKLVYKLVTIGTGISIEFGNSPTIWAFLFTPRP